MFNTGDITYELNRNHWEKKTQSLIINACCVIAQIDYPKAIMNNGTKRRQLVWVNNWV